MYRHRHCQILLLRKFSVLFIFSWIVIRNRPLLVQCAICYGRIRWKITAMKKQVKTIVIIVSEDARIFIGIELAVFLRVSGSLGYSSGDIRGQLISHFSALIQLLFSFDQDMRVKKTSIQTLACQLSSTLMQLLFSFDQDMRVKKTSIQTLACQLSSTLMQLLFSFDQDMGVEKTLIQSLACQLSSTLMQLLFSFDQDMRVEKTLNTISRLSTLMQLLLSFD